MKKVLFLCGSPRGHASTSFYFAQYTTNFLEHEFDFIDIPRAKLSINSQVSEPGFQAIVHKMKQADIFVWVFGVNAFQMPAQMQYFFDKLFTNDHDFTGKLAACIITSRRIKDDHALTRMRFVSEQLGLGYLGDVSADGETFFHSPEEEIAESSCRRLAHKINKALAKNYLPAPQTRPLPRKFLSAKYFGQPVDIPADSLSQKKHKKAKKIIILTGCALSRNHTASAIAKLCDKFSKHKIEVIELEKYKIKPCRGCYFCMIDKACNCRLQDDVIKIIEQLKQAQGIILIANCASGLIDAYLQTFLDRVSRLFYQPCLKNKYGFGVVSGADVWGKGALEYVRDTLNAWGVNCLGELMRIEDESPMFVQTLMHEISELDTAIEQQWQIADRFSARSFRLGLAQHIKKHGLILQGEYAFFKKNKMLSDFKETWPEKIIRFLLKNSFLRIKTISILSEQTKRKRAMRLEKQIKDNSRLKAVIQT